MRLPPVSDTGVDTGGIRERPSPIKKAPTRRLRAPKLRAGADSLNNDVTMEKINTCKVKKEIYLKGPRQFTIWNGPFIT